MGSAKQFFFLNQMAGPLFRELAEGVSQHMECVSELYTGHPDTLKYSVSGNKMRIVPAPGYDRRNKWTRIWSWLKYCSCALFKMLRIPNNSVVLIVSNPPLLGPVAWFVYRLRRIPYIVLVYDIHPDTLISFGVLREKSPITLLWRWANRHVWEEAVGVYTIGSVMAERLEAQFDATCTRLGTVGVVPPWADTGKIFPIEKKDNLLTRELGQQDCITVLYSGNMGISHDIESMLRAAILLKERQDIRFLFIGEGAKWQWACDFVKSESLDNVQVLPFQPEEKLPYTMALGDISLVALDKGAEGLMVPSKMYYYMAAGSAVIGICAGRNDLEQSLKQANCGCVVQPGDPQELATVIQDLVDDKSKLSFLKANARQASEIYFSRHACMKNFIESLKTIAVLSRGGN